MFTKAATSSHAQSNPIWKNGKLDNTIVCCLTVRNCSTFLPKIFENLTQLSRRIQMFHVVFVYDNCTDDSPQQLEAFKSSCTFPVYVIHNVHNTHPLRTVRIAHSRNICLEYVYDVIKNVDFHIMIDADDVNCHPWQWGVIQYYLQQNTWDALSFNRLDYYDIWALLFGDFKHHCMGFGHNYPRIRRFYKKELVKALARLKGRNDLMHCLSAFNGFALYRTPVFEGIRYDGFNTTFMKLVSVNERKLTLKILQEKLGRDIFMDDTSSEVCEHLTYHLEAIHQKNARIRISKLRVQKQHVIAESLKNPKILYYLILNKIYRIIRLMNNFTFKLMIKQNVA